LSSDNQGYFMVTHTVYHNQGCWEIEDVNQMCNGAQSMAMSARTEPPCDENKGRLFRWSRVYSPSSSDWCVRFEIEVSGILCD